MTKIEPARPILIQKCEERSQNVWNDYRVKKKIVQHGSIKLANHIYFGVLSSESYLSETILELCSISWKLEFGLVYVPNKVILCIRSLVPRLINCYNEIYYLGRQRLETVPGQQKNKGTVRTVVLRSLVYLYTLSCYMNGQDFLGIQYMVAIHVSVFVELHLIVHNLIYHFIFDHNCKIVKPKNAHFRGRVSFEICRI